MRIRAVAFAREIINVCSFWLDKAKARCHLEDLSIDNRIIL